MTFPLALQSAAMAPTPAVWAALFATYVDGILSYKRFRSISRLAVCRPLPFEATVSAIKRA